MGGPPIDPKPCEHCGALFKPSHRRMFTGKPQRFCSRICYGAARTAATKVRTEKRCRSCQGVRPIEDFWRDAAHPDGHQNTCKDCCIRRDRASRFLKKYGITTEQYHDLLAQQKGLCAICRQECSNGNSLCVDHDHESGEVRGLLCGNCNIALGNFRDSPELLRAAADYLENLKTGKKPRKKKR